MNKAQAINTAVGCVMASGLEPHEKREVIDVLRRLEQEDPVYQAIREFMPTEEQREGYEALVAWLESTTPFMAEPDVYELDQATGHYFCKFCGNNYLLKEHKPTCKVVSEAQVFGTDCRDGRCEF